jgi:hypothetical protein
VTVEDRYVIDLSELRAVRFDCKHCGTSISFKVSEWHRVPEDCPSCRTSWHHGEGTDEYRTLFMLAKGLRDGIAMMEAQPSRPIPFTMRFEMDRPKT